VHSKATGSDLTGLARAPVRSWPAYPAYKPSGVEWLGDVPAHWEARRLKHLAIEPLKYGASEVADLADPDNPRFIRITDIDESGNLRDKTFRSLPEDIAEPYLLRSGDVLFARSGATVGKTFLYRDTWGRACYAGYLIRFRANRSQIFPEFLAHFATSSFYWDWLSSSFIQATIQNVSAERYANLVIPLPSLDEQRAIATFLDRETAKLDALIAKHERLIELLQEKRTALISHAVTKGLDPSAPMKDSGVPWMGQIPAHWQVFQLRRVAEFVDYRGATPEKVPFGIPLVTARNIKNGAINLDLAPDFIREEDYDGWMVRGFPEVGDVLVTTEAPLGESAQVVDPKIALAQRIILLKADKCRITNDYLKYYLASQSGQGELWSRATGSTAIGIKAYHLKEALLTVPPINEQQAIAASLDRETAKLDALIARVRQGIEKLREYRAALISAAVMGKIDVRGSL
jgi:type I restriction enzyme S subunit